MEKKTMPVVDQATLVAQVYNLQERIEKATSPEQKTMLQGMLDAVNAQLDPISVIGALELAAQGKINPVLYPNLSSLINTGALQAIADLVPLKALPPIDKQLPIQFDSDEKAASTLTLIEGKLETSRMKPSNLYLNLDAKQQAKSNVIEVLKNITNIGDLTHVADQFRSSADEWSPYFGASVGEALATIFRDFTFDSEFGEANILRRYIKDLIAPLEKGTPDALALAVLKMTFDFNCMSYEQVLDTLSECVTLYIKDTVAPLKDKTDREKQAMALQEILYNESIFDPSIAWQNTSVKGYLKELYSITDETTAILELQNLTRTVSKQWHDPEELDKIYSERGISFTDGKKVMENVPQEIKDDLKKDGPTPKSNNRSTQNNRRRSGRKK